MNFIFTIVINFSIAMVQKICKFGSRCKYGQKCRFFHPSKLSTHVNKVYPKNNFLCLLNKLPNEVLNNIYDFANPYKILYREITRRLSRIPMLLKYSWCRWQESCFLYYKTIDNRSFVLSVEKQPYQMTITNAIGYGIKKSISSTTPIVLRYDRRKYYKPKFHRQNGACWGFENIHKKPI